MRRAGPWGGIGGSCAGCGGRDTGREWDVGAHVWDAGGLHLLSFLWMFLCWAPTGGPVTARAGMGAVPSAGAREGLVGRQGGCKGSGRSKPGAHREGGGEVVDGFEGERRPRIMMSMS